MLETLMKLYVTSMLGHVYSPMPHLFGPAGAGKSTVCYELAKLVDRKVHVINVSRISPLELEGVQMPNHDNTKLNLLTATFWTQLQDGDILLLDEFLRGFPEVYNGMLDILTSREVAGFKIPNVFILGASNSVVAYDAALEDRLMHMPVPDIRKNNRERDAVAARIAAAIGLMPEMASSYEMQEMIRKEIDPMYGILDSLKGAVVTGSTAGHSARNLIGQARMRHAQSSTLRELIHMNNSRALKESKPQYVVIADRPRLNDTAMIKYRGMVNGLIGNDRLTDLQKHNLNLNLQLISMEESRSEREVPADDVVDADIF